MQVINMPYSPDWVDYLNQAGKTFGNLIQQREQVLMREIAQRAFMDMLQRNPNYRWRTYYNPLTGNTTYSVVPRISRKTASPKPPSPYKEAKAQVGVMAGTLNPSVLAPSTQKALTPLSVGKAEGGQVLTPPGAVYNNGQIISNGRPIGEYLPGYEPKVSPAVIPAMLRGKTGITKEQAIRRFYGLKEPKKTKSKKSSLQDMISKLSTAKKSSVDKYVIGKVYRDAKGRKAKYLGSGKWELL